MLEHLLRGLRSLVYCTIIVGPSQYIAQVLGYMDQEAKPELSLSLRLILLAAGLLWPFCAAFAMRTYCDRFLGTKNPGLGAKSYKTD